ncbi:MAG: vWA domain-containing protein [Planctomycetaceae bacterium]
MSFAAPSALFWLALAVPIVGLYILKVRLRRVPVSTNLFWKQLYEEKPPRSIWQYLRHLLSLLLQLGLLALLVSAVADPFFAWQAKQARRVVLVIDRSASMQAADIEPTRFDAAIAAARDQVEGLRARDELAIVLAGDPPQVAVGMNGHLPTLRRVLDELQASDGPTALTPAIELGRRLIGDHPQGEIVVLTDGCQRESVEEIAGSSPDASTGLDKPAAGVGEDSETAAESAITIEHRYFATPAANVGITQFQVRRSLLDPLGYEVLTVVKNAGNKPVECRLELELDGLPVDILPLKLTADEVWTRSIEKTSLEGGRLTATLVDVRLQSAGNDGPAAEGGNQSEHADAKLTDAPAGKSSANWLATDDIAAAILPARKVQTVLIVSPGNWFLEKVFEANPLVAVEVVEELPEQWPAETLVVLHRLVPPQLPAGQVLVIDPTESSDLWTLGEPLANPIITEQDQNSPLMTHVRLDNVLMPAARQLKFSVKPHVLAGSVSGEPIYAELPREAGRCLVLTVNLEEGDLAFRTAFPILVSNALGWFAGTSGELNRAVSTGDIATLTVPSTTVGREPTYQLRDPAGRLQNLSPPAADDDAGTVLRESLPLTVGPLERVGIYEVLAGVAGRTAAPSEEPETESSPLASLAVNLANADESDLRPPEHLDASRPDAALVAGWFTRPFWFYLAAAAGLVAVLEWFLYQRRFVD